MNIYDKVFFTVKKHCLKQNQFAEIDCFDTIAKEADVSIPKLESHLDYLQNIGLLKFSAKDNYIYLTQLGKKYEEREEV